MGPGFIHLQPSDHASGRSPVARTFVLPPLPPPLDTVAVPPQHLTAVPSTQLFKFDNFLLQTPNPSLRFLLPIDLIPIEENSEILGAMRGHKSAATSETAAHDGKKGGCSSGSGEVGGAAPVWPPKFVIALTNKEKEEDFMAIKGSKLPLRLKKRAKIIQSTVNLVCPGTWLCDLTLERYEVREKKTSKKRARGLKAIVKHGI